MKTRKIVWIIIGIALLVALSISAVYRPVVVEGRSMMPTYKDRQTLLMERHFTSPLRRGDVVVVNFDGETMIKRIYGLGGDEMEYAVAPNGARILMAATDLQREKLRRFAIQSPYRVRLETYRVPPDHIYVLGDNHRESGDSREFGPVPVEDVLGRVVSARQAVRQLRAGLVASLPCARARAQTVP